MSSLLLSNHTALDDTCLNNLEVAVDRCVTPNLILSIHVICSKIADLLGLGIHELFLLNLGISTSSYS